MTRRAAAFFVALTAASAATLPAGFQPNAGRFDPRISFVAQGREYGVSLEPGAVRFLLTGKTHNRGAVMLRFPGSREAQAVADGPSIGHVNYFIGGDPAHWTHNLDEFARVRYPSLYDGIDLALYENGGRLEHDFIVKPGADPAAVALAFTGANKLRLSSDGALLIGTQQGELRFEPPALYQEIGGKKVTVDGGYRLERGARMVRFDVGDYDRSRELVIDPTVVFTVNLTGSGVETGLAVTSDAQGNMYIAGVTTSMDLELLTPAQKTFGGGIGDCFVAKWAPTGKLIYSTYLGGSSQDQPQQIRVDAQGNAVVLGFTHSPDFPTVNPLPSGGYPPPGPDPINGQAITFISKLDPTGSKLVHSTLLWSNNLEAFNATGMALDSVGNAYVTGFDPLAGPGVTNGNGMPIVTSPRLIPTAGAYQAPKLAVGANHVWVAKLSPSGALAWDAVIGGSNQEQASGIDVDSSGQVYVAGFTGSSDFPVTANNGVQQTLLSKAQGNAFLVVLNPAGSQIVYGTYLGGSGTDIANAVAAIPGVGVAIGGLTSSPDLAVTPGANQTTLLPNKHNGFYALLNPPGLTVPAPASSASAAAADLKPRDEGPITTLTYEADVVKEINVLGGTFIHYEFVVLLDSDTGDVASIIVFQTTRTVLGPFGGESKSVEFIDVPPGTTDAEAFLNGLGLGTTVDATGAFPASTPIPPGRAHPMDATLGAAAIGVRLAYPPAIVNAASFAPSAVSPGEIVTIFGSNLGPAKLVGAQLDSTGKKLSTSVAGTQVFFDNDPAPVVYTEAGQVSVVVPYSVAGKTSVNMIPFYNGALQDAIPINVAPSAPGIFTVDGKQAASVNPDGSANSASHPIARGSTIVMFATGEGQTDPPGVDGQLATSPYPKPVLPVSVTIGGKPSSLAYYGAAPGETAGLLQLNVVVPSDIQPGNAAVVLTVGSVTSQSGVTIAVK
ncbi:MAG TPA: IPT/TIG domain-containing protein [Bryobacteraceae bacterium]|jgi:uncharacterized protein (TIGR03437 family)|nr:IPT/TIG domain-containing protein [Bryobacteraceae bacterium]